MLNWLKIHLLFLSVYNFTEGTMIKILSFLTLLLILFNVITFSVTHNVSTNNKEQRTRIIAGVPAHDKDYKLPKQEAMLKSQSNSN